MSKSAEAFRTISEVSEELGVPQHVLRFWETKFVQVKPLKRGGGRRYYRPADVDVIRGIQTLLYTDGYTIRGVQKVFRSQGVRYVAEVGRAGGIRLAPVGARIEPAGEPQFALEPANDAAPAPQPTAKPVRHKPYARTRPVEAARIEPAPAAQLSLVETPPLKLNEKEKARMAERLAALTKLKSEILNALAGRSERTVLSEPRAIRA